MDKSVYYLFNKPFGCLSQFTKEHESHTTLADIINVPKSVYPIGRLDKDSEGLLLLSNDKIIVDKILNPKFHHNKTYHVQVEGDITDEALLELAKGVRIKHKGQYYQTLACSVKSINEPNIWERNPPIRFRASIPESWCQITIHEGKNRQIRKMFASVGFPVLRLVRVRIESLVLDSLQPGEYREMTRSEFYSKLNIES